MLLELTQDNVIGWWARDVACLELEVCSVALEHEQ